MQLLRLPFWGALVYFLLVVLMGALFSRILSMVHSAKINGLLTLVPATFMAMLPNHAHFPLEVILSILLILIAVWAFSKLMLLVHWYLCFVLLFLLSIYACGPGFALLFALLCLILVWSRGEKDLIPGSAGILLAGSMVLFLLPRLFPDLTPIQFFGERPLLLPYHPRSVLYATLLSFPLLMLVSMGMKHWGPTLASTIGVVLLLGMTALIGHRNSSNADARRIVSSNYYAYHGMARQCRRVLSDLEEYSMMANLNFTLAHLKAGTLSEHFFEFFQIRGVMALQPDFDFASEHAFISAEYYYEMGFISEARHWAYEALVYYPHSPRALQLLVKVHLVLGEREAASNCLHILEKGIGYQHFIRKYKPLVEDESLALRHAEIVQKRRQIPREKELNPHIQGRFMELLEADASNRAAYEGLMLYFLLEARLDDFFQYMDFADAYFEHLPGPYQEALMIYGAEKQLDMFQIFSFDEEVLSRYATFQRVLEKNKGKPTRSRNELYWEMGSSYYFYHKFVQPRVVIPEMGDEIYEEAPI